MRRTSSHKATWRTKLAFFDSTSRVFENGHTTPNVETMERFASALDVPLYRLFYDGNHPSRLPKLLKRKSTHDLAHGSEDKDDGMLAQVCYLFSRASANNRKLLLILARRIGKSRLALQSGEAERPEGR